MTQDELPSKDCMRGVTSVEDVISQTVADEGDGEQQAEATNAATPSTRIATFAGVSCSELGR